MNNESKKGGERPDLRSTFYFYLRFDSFENYDVNQIQKDALEALSGYMDRDTVFEAVLPLLHRLKLPIPRVDIIAGTLADTNLTEREAKYMLAILFETGSGEVYQDEVDGVFDKYPELKDIPFFGKSPGATFGI